MATKLKDLKITSTDLVEQGANPDANIRLFKRKTVPSDDNADQEGLLQKCLTAIAGVFGKSGADPVTKTATTFNEEIAREQLRSITSEIWNYDYALSDSLTSIICDVDLSDEAKKEKMFTSLDEFTETMRDAIPNWASGSCAKKDSEVMKSEIEQETFDRYWGEIAKAMSIEPSAKDEHNTDDGTVQDGAPATESNAVGKSHQNEKEEIDTMKIDKSKLNPEEIAALEAIEKKAGASEPETKPVADDDVKKGAGLSAESAPDLHPEVKKALEVNKALTEQVEDLKKSLEIKDLSAVAKKYELIGKKADELAPKLYDMKKAGGTAYDDYIALLDEHLTTVEKSGLFSERGKNTSGLPGISDEIGIKAAEVAKSNDGISHAAAVAKAYEDNPELAAQYEQEYMEGGRK